MNQGLFSLKEFSFNGVHLVNPYGIREILFSQFRRTFFMFLQYEKADNCGGKRGECIVVFVVGSLR